MARSHGGGRSSSAKVHGCRGLRFFDFEARAAAAGSLSFVPMDVKLEKDQEGSAHVDKGVGIPQKILSAANDVHKVDATSEIDRALLKPDVVTLCTSAGTVCNLGQKRYMLTEHSYPASCNLAQKVKDEFGTGARIAESSDLFQVGAKELENFARDIGLGSAFVSFEGSSECGSEEQFYFICSHSGVVPDRYIVPPDVRDLDPVIWRMGEEKEEDEKENECGKGETDEKDEDEYEDWKANIRANVARVDLCSRAGRRLPVLVEVSASQNDSAYCDALASSFSTRISL